MKRTKTHETFSDRQLEAELKEAGHRSRCRSVWRGILCIFVVAAAAVLAAALWLPVLQIYGNSMTPTLRDGEIIFCVKTSDFEPGDIAAFYYNNKILVKRVICGPGDWIDMDEDGVVYVNEARLEEPYLEERAFGECDIELPFQVPEGQYFIMGDNRLASADSRSAAVGCVSGEQIIGKIIFRVWPLKRLGFVG